MQYLEESKRELHFITVFEQYQKLEVSGCSSNTLDFENKIKAILNDLMYENLFEIIKDIISL